ncbi:MAG: ChaN family lipoprotein [Chitinophagaceae bacterium]|nr:ChaN family lipoprotein [Oligoflexus sp.]
MSSSALSILHAFHQQLQQSTLDGIKHFHGQTPAIASYAQRFHKCLPSTYKKIASASLIECVLSSEVMLFGDFHTLPQSQGAFFDVLRQTYERSAGRPITVAMEIFAANDQDHIDDFLAGRLPEEYFLKRTDYHNKWGFPWENYKPIVDYCVQNKIAIVGINCQTGESNRLAKRDLFAADIINNLHSSNTDTLVLCLIGEYHLADQHLPKCLDHRRIVRIVNNIDDYSLPALDRGTQNFQALELGANFFCVLNTSPWLKWQSLAMWEELHGVSEDSFYGGENDAYTVQEYDFEYQLLFILKSMNEFLGLGISASDLSFDIYLKPDRPTLSYLRSKFGLSRTNYAIAERKLHQDGFCYIPRAKAILLLDFSMHHLLEAAGFILMDCVNKRLPKQGSFIQRVHYQICGTLCGLIMNPRRQTSTLDQVERDLKRLQRKRLSGELRKYREAYKGVRDFHEEGVHSVFKSSKSLEERDKDANFLISRIFGETIASEIFQVLLADDEAEFKKGLAALFTTDLVGQLQYVNRLAGKLRSAS